MTYSLNTLTQSGSAGASTPRPAAIRFAQELALIASAAVLLYWLLAMATYSAQDPAFSTSGSGPVIANWGGRLGAWLADGSYFLLGYSSWWCFAVGVRAWLATLARWMRGADAPSSGWTRGRVAFWIALALLLCASSALEWSRLYRFEGHLPDHAGGALGFLVGPAAVQWLGFTGSGLLAVAVMVVCTSIVFRFSWGHVAERIGGRIEALVRKRREKREIAQDV